MDSSKGFHNNRDERICDAVFSIKKDGSLVNTYPYGMIHQLEKSKYCFIRQAVVKYCNYNGNVNRFFGHAVDKLVLIYAMNELYFMEKLDNLAPT